MTPRYIDANLIEFYPDTDSEVFAFKTQILKIPTADVAPVAHGHWYFTEYEYFGCSVCGESYYNGCDTSAEARSRLENGDVFAFCPHCGAKMDEKPEKK